MYGLSLKVDTMVFFGSFRSRKKSSGIKKFVFAGNFAVFWYPA
jgi:hypothetical protein